MDFDDLKNDLNNPKINLDNGMIAMQNISDSLHIRYHLKIILRTQLELLELHKGKTASALEDAVDEKMNYWAKEFDKWHEVDFPSTIQNCVSDK